MFMLFRNHPSSSPARNAVRGGMLSAGVLSLLFGLLVIAVPELLAYIIASFFVVIGVSLVITWWNLR